MKKAMVILMCCISFLTSVAFGFYEKARDNERMDRIERTADSTYFYIKESNISIEEELIKFKELSKKYHATFIRSDRLFEDKQEVIYKSGIYAEGYFESLNLKLSTGHLPQSEHAFLATYHTENVNQSGIIQDLFKDCRLIFGSLDSFYQKNPSTVAGTYSFVANPKDKDAILRDLSDFFGISQNVLLEQTSGVVYGEGTIYVFSLVLIVIVFAIFCLMNMFYPISRLKEIGVMKLQGYKYFDIWKQLNYKIIMIPIIFYFISIIIQKIFIKDSGYAYFFKLTQIQFMIFLICMFFSLFMLVVIRKFSISNMLKHFFNFRFSLYFSYVLKFFVFVGLIFTIPQISVEFKRLGQTLSVKKVYEEQQNYLTLSRFIYVGDEFEQFLKGIDPLEVRLINLYKELEQTADCQYVSTTRYASNILTDVLSEVETEKWEDVRFYEDDHFVVMEANQNYLERIDFDFQLSLSEIFDGDQFTVLVPESLREKKDKIEYFVHYLSRTYIYESREIQPNHIDMVPVKILYYPDNNKSLFSENFDMIDVDNGFIKNPIFFCLSNRFFTKRATGLSVSALSNPIRILDTEENRQAIQTAIINNGLELNEIQFQNVLSTGFVKELRISQTSMAAWIGIIFLAISVSVLASYYIVLIILISQKKKMLVSRLLGYPLVERYQNEIFYFVAMYLFGFAEILVISWQVIPLLIYMIVVCMDSLVVYLMVKSHEKGSLNLALKGEE